MTEKRMQNTLDMFLNLADQTRLAGLKLLNEADEKDRGKIAPVIQKLQQGNVSKEYLEYAKYMLRQYCHVEPATKKDAEVKPGIPEVRIDTGKPMSVIVPCNGGTLQVYAGQMGEVTCAGILWQEHAGHSPEIDLAYAEVKNGDYAEAAGLAKDNKQVDLYLYGDPANEEWTEKLSYPYSELHQVSEENDG